MHDKFLNKIYIVFRGNLKVSQKDFLEQISCKILNYFYYFQLVIRVIPSAAIHIAEAKDVQGSDNGKTVILQNKMISREQSQLCWKRHTY